MTTVRGAAPAAAPMRAGAGRITVGIYATDPISAHGLMTCLPKNPRFAVVPVERLAEASVVVGVIDRLTGPVVDGLLERSAPLQAPIILVAEDVRVQTLPSLAGTRVAALLSRQTATCRQISDLVAEVRRVRAAPASLAAILGAEPAGRAAASLPAGKECLTEREIEVARLLADGLDTNEVASRLNYSERTVKTILYRVLQRLDLRNRAHLVAYVLRQGLI